MNINKAENPFTRHIRVFLYFFVNERIKREKKIQSQCGISNGNETKRSREHENES